MKIIYAFLFSLSMVIAGGELHQIIEQIPNTIEFLSKSKKDLAELVCANKPINTYCKSDIFLNAHMRIQAVEGDDGFGYKYVVKTPLWPANIPLSVLPKSVLQDQEYEWHTLPDEIMRVTVTNQEDLDSLLALIEKDPDLLDTIQWSCEPTNEDVSLEVKHRQSIHEFEFKFRKSGEHNRKYLIFDMAKFAQSVHHMLNKHNQILNTNELDRFNPKYLLRTNYVLNPVNELDAQTDAAAPLTPREIQIF